MVSAPDCDRRSLVSSSALALAGILHVGGRCRRRLLIVHLNELFERDGYRGVTLLGIGGLRLG